MIDFQIADYIVSIAENEIKFADYLKNILFDWSNAKILQTSSETYIESNALKLIAALPHMTNIHSYTASILQGIDLHLEHLNRSIRTQGMIVAEIFSQRFGKPVDFQVSNDDYYTQLYDIFQRSATKRKIQINQNHHEVEKPDSSSNELPSEDLDDYDPIINSTGYTAFLVDSIDTILSSEVTVKLSDIMEPLSFQIEHCNEGILKAQLVRLGTVLIQGDIEDSLSHRKTCLKVYIKRLGISAIDFVIFLLYSNETSLSQKHLILVALAELAEDLFVQCNEQDSLASEQQKLISYILKKLLRYPQRKYLLSKYSPYFLSHLMDKTLFVATSLLLTLDPGISY
jgi:hypothetical protein